MYKIIFIFFLFFSIETISANQNELDFSLCMDSIDNVLFSVPQCKDSLKISSMILLCEKLQQRDISAEQVFILSIKEGQLLGMLGKYAEGFLIQENGVYRLDTNDIRRLEFYALKYKYTGDIVKSNMFFNKAIEECDKMMDNKYIPMLKFTILLAKGDYIRAKEWLIYRSKKFKDKQARDTLNDIDEYIQQSKESDLFMKKILNDFYDKK